MRLVIESMEDKNLKAQLAALNIGDLVCVGWCDASIGKSSDIGTAIDVPVKSWGVFIGVLGEKVKHIVLAQNSFRYADGLFDLDFTAIPLSWTINIAVLAREHIPKQIADQLAKSFSLGGRKAFTPPRTFQQRLSTHGRPN
jgi:hypothetical protein